MPSRRDVLCLAGALTLLPVLSACSQPGVRLEWVERWFRDHPAVASMDLQFYEGTWFWQSTRLDNSSSVTLKPDLSAAEVLDFTRYVTELVHRESPRLSGSLMVDDPGRATDPSRHRGWFTFPDFGSYPPVDVVQAVARHRLDLAGRYERPTVGFSSDDSTNVFARVDVPARAVPSALDGAFGDLARHRIPADLTVSFSVGVADPTGQDGALASDYATESGAPPAAVVAAMTALATFNEQLAPDERAWITAYWWSRDGGGELLDVRAGLRPRELRDLPAGEIDAAVPGSTAPRTADELGALLDRAAVPYELGVGIGSGSPFRTLDRTGG